MQAPQRHKLLERHSQNMSDLQHLAVQENTVHQRIHNLRNRIEALLCIAAALSTAYYGNGESDMLFVVMNDSKIKR